MNLYEFSQQNNREMGILIDKSEDTDKQVFDDAWKDIESILHNADDFAYVKAPKVVERVATKDDAKTKWERWLEKRFNRERKISSYFFQIFLFRIAV